MTPDDTTARRAAMCSGKDRFQTPQQAWRRTQRAPGLVHYRCSVCGYFHIGHPSEWGAKENKRTWKK